MYQLLTRELYTIINLPVYTTSYLHFLRNIDTAINHSILFFPISEEKNNKVLQSFIIAILELIQELLSMKNIRRELKRMGIVLKILSPAENFSPITYWPELAFKMTKKRHICCKIPKTAQKKFK